MKELSINDNHYNISNTELIMKKILLPLFGFIIVILFTQCATPKSHRQIFKLMQKEYNTSSWGFPEDTPIFTKCRKSALKRLLKDAFENDTIIIIEYVPDRSYRCFIYESRYQNANQYRYKFLKKEEEITFNTTSHDSILFYAKNNQLKEIKRRGDNSSLTPLSWLIVNVLTKRDRKKFEIKAIKTYRFPFYNNYNN